MCWNIMRMNNTSRPLVGLSIRQILSVLSPIILSLFTGKGLAAPTGGAHTLAFFPCNGTGGLTTPSITTQTSGSTILAWVGRGNTNGFTGTVPLDNKTNIYNLLGSIHDYSPLYPGSGEALYAVLSATGGSGHRVTAPMPAGSDEITLAVVEVKNGGAIHDARFNKVLSPPHTSQNVITTSAATLIAVWAGDSGAASVTAAPNNGFTTIDSQLLSGCDVEVVVATKDVAGAGTYNVTWTATPSQGAHLWLVAVQSAPPILQAQITGRDVIIRWPGAATNYSLETADNVSSGNSWKPVMNAPVIIDSQNTVTNIISQPSQYYRLKKQTSAALFPLFPSVKKSRACYVGPRRGACNTK
jgi:hypothetical protein